MVRRCLKEVRQISKACDLCWYLVLLADVRPPFVAPPELDRADWALVGNAGAMLDLVGRQLVAALEGLRATLAQVGGHRDASSRERHK